MKTAKEMEMVINSSTEKRKNAENKTAENRKNTENKTAYLLHIRSIKIDLYNLNLLICTLFEVSKV